MLLYCSNQLSLATRSSSQLFRSLLSRTLKHKLIDKLIINSSILDNRAVTTQVPATTRKMQTMAAIAPEIKAASKVLQSLGFRLPTEALKPRKYNLQLRPDLSQKNYTGNISIQLQVLKPISFIPVHVNQLNVSHGKMQRLDESGAPLADIKPYLTFAYPEFEYWVTEFEQPLEVGNYSLQLNFNGSLIDRITGLYQSSYFDTLKNRTR